MKYKAVFLDRDGVINEDFGYISSVENFKFKKNIFNLLRFFRDKSFKLFVVTNQSGIGRGYFSLEQYQLVNDYMLKKIKESGLCIEEVAMCPHKPNIGCICRKPSPYLIKNLLKKHSLCAGNSIMIGDKLSDCLAAKKAGVKTTFLISQENLVHSSVKDRKSVV